MMKTSFSLSRAVACVVLAFIGAATVHAEDGVMTFGEIKLQGPPANQPEYPKEPHVYGQFLNVNPQDGPFRVKAKVKNAQGRTIEALIEVRGSMAEISKTKSFPVFQYRDTPGKAYVSFDDGASLTCTPKTGGTVTFTAIGQEGGIVTGSFSGVKWFSDACQRALSGSGSFRVQRAENY